MEQPDSLETRVLATLARFASLPWSQVVVLILKQPGLYTWKSEQELKALLENLMRRGIVIGPDRWGPFRIAPSTPAVQAAGRSKARPRLRSERP
jgi:hypothetical protein